MRKSVLTCLFAIMVTVNASAAEFGDASLSIKEAVNLRCEGEDCVGVFKGNISLSANVLLTGPEAAALNEQTTISISTAGFDFAVLLGSDPNFQNGDTSVKLTVPTEVLGESIVADAKIQLNWANDDFKAKVSMVFTGDASALTKAILVAKKSKVAKDPNGVEMSISAVEGVTTIFQSETFVTGDEKEITSRTDTAEGNLALKDLLTFKSKNVPLP